MVDDHASVQGTESERHDDATLPFSCQTLNRLVRCATTSARKCGLRRSSSIFSSVAGQRPMATQPARILRARRGRHSSPGKRWIRTASSPLLVTPLAS